MKHFILFLPLILVFGCSSDDVTPSGTINNTGASVRVNLAGAWDYQIVTQNSICDGLIANGTMTVQTLPSDASKIGNILLSGDGYDNDNFGNCFIVQVTETETGWSGRPIEQTADEYLAFVQADNVGDNTIASVRLDAFNDSKISEVETLTNSVVITSTITR